MRSRSKRRQPKPYHEDRRFPRTNLAVVKPVALSKLTPGTVVYAQVPFAERSGSKSRPCVVICRDRHTVTVAPISSSYSARCHAKNKRIADPEAASVLDGSVVVPQRIVIERADVYSVQGEVDEETLRWINIYARDPR